MYVYIYIKERWQYSKQDSYVQKEKEGVREKVYSMSKGGRVITAITSSPFPDDRRR